MHGEVRIWSLINVTTYILLWFSTNISDRALKPVYFFTLYVNDITHGLKPSMAPPCSFTAPFRITLINLPSFSGTLVHSSLPLSSLLLQLSLLSFLQALAYAPPLPENARWPSPYPGDLSPLPFLHLSALDPIPRPPRAQYSFYPNKSDRNACICVAGTSVSPKSWPLLWQKRLHLSVFSPLCPRVLVASQALLGKWVLGPAVTPLP